MADLYLHVQILDFNVYQFCAPDTNRKEIGSKLKLLVILSLAGCPRVTMANLLYLCGCVSLEVCCCIDPVIFHNLHDSFCLLQFVSQDEVSCTFYFSSHQLGAPICRLYVW